jgi:hypothetical protein
MLRHLCRVALVFAVVLLTACSAQKPRAAVPKKNVNNPTYTLILDKSFGGPEREIIVDEFGRWERDTNETVKFKVANYTFDPSLEEIPEVGKGECTYDTYIYRVNALNEDVRKLDARENGKTLGFTRSSCTTRVVALITERLSNAKLFRQVVFHEAGHLVGLDHIPVPKESVMFPSVDKASPCATALDMKQFCMLYECDWKAMKFCE